MQTFRPVSNVEILKKRAVYHATTHHATLLFWYLLGTIKEEAIPFWYLLVFLKIM